MTPDGRYLSSHHAQCPSCPCMLARVYVVEDRPIIEETRCADCHTLISVNGVRVHKPEVECLVGDGEGRR